MGRSHWLPAACFAVLACAEPPEDAGSSDTGSGQGPAESEQTETGSRNTSSPLGPTEVPMSSTATTSEPDGQDGGTAESTTGDVFESPEHTNVDSISEWEDGVPPGLNMSETGCVLTRAAYWDGGCHIEIRCERTEADLKLISSCGVVGTSDPHSCQCVSMAYHANIVAEWDYPGKDLDPCIAAMNACTEYYI